MRGYREPRGSAFQATAPDRARSAQDAQRGPERCTRRRTARARTQGQRRAGGGVESARREAVSVLRWSQSAVRAVRGVSGALLE